MKHFFLSRATTAVLMASALLAVILSAAVPQTFRTLPEQMRAWRISHPILSKVSALLGLHHIYTHPLFMAVLAGIAVSLAVSAWNQCVAAWKRKFSLDPVETPETFSTPLPIVRCTARLIRDGYFRRRSAGNVLLLVRRPWGYWGNALFHLGMLLTITASLVIAVTQQQAILQLAQGVTQRPHDPLPREEHGVLASPLILPDAVRLDRMDYRFRSDNSVSEVASTLSFLSPDGSFETKKVEINKVLLHRGLRVYQGAEFGHAFFVEVTGPGPQTRLFQLQIQHPQAPGRPSYNDFENLLGRGITLRAKYVLDDDWRLPGGAPPLLTLRLDSLGKEVGQVPLRPGGTGSMGPYTFRLQAFAPWSRLILVNLTGLPFVFLGFFIMSLGGVLHYFAVPCEIGLSETASGGTTLSWRATRFAPFFEEELAALQQGLGGGEG